MSEVINRVYRSIALELYNTASTPVRVNAIQADTATRYLRVTLVNDGSVYDVDAEAHPQLFVVKPDETVAYNSGTLITYEDYGDDGSISEKVESIEFELTNQTLAQPGQIAAEVLLWDKDFEQVVRSVPFYIYVSEKIDDLEAVESSDEYGALVTLMQEAESYISSIGRVEDHVNVLELKARQVEVVGNQLHLTSFGGEADSRYSNIDDTLTVKGMAADSKAAGDAIRQLEADVETLNEGGLAIKDDVVQSGISDWLDEHPEATTTVQDGTITEAKLDSALKAKMGKDYVTPSMLGAVCDGTTDDTQALQDCVDYAALNRIPVKIDKDIFIDATITVPNYVRIEGNTHYEYYPYIIAGPNCTTVLNCTGFCNILKDFGIKTQSGEYSSGLTGVVLWGDANFNVDSELDNLVFGTFDKSVVVKGRNAKIINCVFSYSRYGVYYDLSASGIQYRGLQVEGCRFHGIGNLSALNWFEDSAGIRIEENVGGNLTVRNCISDEGGTFFQGYCSNGLIENNFVESFKAPIIDIDGVGTPFNMGTLLISGNAFNGKYGTVSTGGDTVDYPDCLISINNSARASIIGNVLRHSANESIRIKDSNQITVSSNTFLNAGARDTTKNVAVTCDNSGYISLIGNTAQSNGMSLYTATSQAIVYVNSNSEFASFSAEGIVPIENKDWQLLGTAQGNSNITFNLPDEFFVRLNDNHTAFRCSRQGYYISNAVSFSADALSFYALSFTYSNGYFMPRLRLYNVANMANPTEQGYTMYFYALVN